MDREDLQTGATFHDISSKLRSAIEQLDRDESIEYNSVEELVADIESEGRARLTTGAEILDIGR
jgi:hypothetical protein